MNSFSTVGDPVSVFYYKGKYYCNRTEIALKDEFIKHSTFNEKKLWKYARFSHKIVDNGKVKYFFCRCKDTFADLYNTNVTMKDINDYAPYFTVEAFRLDSLIEEIIRPIEFTNIEMLDFHLPKKDYEVKEMIALWIIYIAIMIGSLIFNEFYIIWIIITYLFFKLRNEILNNR